MDKWRIDLKKIGRGKITRSIEVKAETLPDVEDRAIRECSQHLMSRDIGLVDKADLTYIVYAGCHSVGHVSITAI